jgi:DNA-binding IclR family transcriptional regulator
MRLPLHCTALGKVLLACAPESVREGFDRDVASQGLERRTEHTITDRDKFFEHLQSVRVPGYALDLDECEVGMQCAAAPVYDACGAVRAALSVSGPSFRLGEETLLRRVVPLVTSAAERLSRDLGYQTSP